MMTSGSLTQKTVSGMFWSFSDSIAGQIIHFIVGLILARILSPSEFGLIGMITVFLAISQSFVDSGFGQALIRKPEANEADYSTVFFFNILVGLVFFGLFYLLAPGIARFYNEPEIQSLTRVLSIILIINSFGIIQRTILIKKIDFKLQMKITIVSAIISGSVAIYMALNDFGVWSLVWKSLISYFSQTLLLWIFSKWRPRLLFSTQSFRELFAFGSKLMISGLIDTIYKNIYPLIIGKFFSAQELGFYSRADQFTRLPSQNITASVQRVSYPSLSMVQDDHDKLKSGYKKIIISTMFITFFTMLGMAAVAKAMILVLIGEKWLPVVPYLQLLCFGGMLYPLLTINSNMLKVKGRSDLLLQLEIIKKFLAIPVIIAGIFLGIYALLIGLIVISFVAFFINGYYSGRMINYPLREQIGDILPTFLIALSVSSIIYSISFFLDIRQIFILIIQIISGFFLIIIICELSRLKSYLDIKSIILMKIYKIRTKAI